MMPPLPAIALASYLFNDPLEDTEIARGGCAGWDASVLLVQRSVRGY